MAQIVKKHIATGIVWVSIKEAEVFICCGCPVDSVKHLKKAGEIHELNHGDQYIESGPNAILLSDATMQNNQISNMAEFPILQMLYMQGVNISGHVNFKKFKPILIGAKEQVQKQFKSFEIGNHGFSSVQKIIDAGIAKEQAEKIFAGKVFFSGGKINSLEDIVVPKVLENDPIEIKNGVYVARKGFNKFEIRYRNERVNVDLNLSAGETYAPPYLLPMCQFAPAYFAVAHTGQGNGWDIERPCMASVIRHGAYTYIIDVGPNILNNLAHIGIGPSEISGIFLSHIHDDHFAGITELLQAEQKVNLYTTALVRSTAEKKLEAMIGSEISALHTTFHCIDLEPDEWNMVNGMEIKPFFSPHTIETNVFHFRVLDGEKYKSYIHLSDAIGLKAYQMIIDHSPELFSDADMEYVKQAYLTKADLKKIDIGGGMIHGYLRDYLEDKSELMVMAHTDGMVDPPKENIINVDFGVVHTLINHDNLSTWKDKATAYMQVYFPMLDENHIERIVGLMDFRQFRPGEKLLKSMPDSKVKMGFGIGQMLVLSGLVVCENAPNQARQLGAGNVIGANNTYFGNTISDCTAKSYATCSVMGFEGIERLIQEQNIEKDLNDRLAIIEQLKKSDFIQNDISDFTFVKLANAAKKWTLGKSEFSKLDLHHFMYILTEGNVQVESEVGTPFRIATNQYFGGEALYPDRMRNYNIEEKIRAISIPVNIIHSIPKLVWSINELEQERSRAIIDHI